MVSYCNFSDFLKFSFRVLDNTLRLSFPNICINESEYVSASNHSICDNELFNDDVRL